MIKEKLVNISSAQAPMAASRVDSAFDVHSDGSGAIEETLVTAELPPGAMIDRQSMAEMLRRFFSEARGRSIGTARAKQLLRKFKMGTWPKRAPAIYTLPSSLHQFAKEQAALAAEGDSRSWLMQG